ncbi:hypothetical protein SteCoe_20852 [Stentor coeruleus]|uniref:Cytochrome b561 domain-containing protein n=1 Tax=Stentor coeruleus TaxID=5963 RepID=A0A1R2BR45_9CILI|nr:hypothetical protein SteCoe_20852 [Stentor coeruleus]
MVQIKLYTLFDKGSLLILAILYLNLISSCVFTISCDSYLPTLSYLGTFRVHDLGVVLAVTLQSFILLILFIAFHHSLDFRLSKDDKCFMIIHEIAILMLIILLGILDESSTIDFNPFDDVHRFASFAFALFCISWGYWALKLLETNKLREKQKLNAHIAFNVYVAGIAFTLMTMTEWHFAYTIYNNLIFNQIAESLCEWTAVTIAARFPYHLCKVMDSSIEISLNKEKEKIYQ